MTHSDPATEAGGRGGNGPRLTAHTALSPPRHTLRDVLIVVFRERRLILSTFALILLAGVLASFGLGTVYVA